MATLTNNMNYLMPTGFKIVIDRENYPNIEYFCQSVSHPSLSLAPSELPYRKVRNIPLAGGTIDYGNLDISIILDEDLKGYTEMHDWMIRITDEKLQGPLDRVTGGVPSSADITLTVLNSQNNKVKSIRYNQCSPTELGAISFDTTGGGTDYLTCTMSFRFLNFELI